MKTLLHSLLLLTGTGALFLSTVARSAVSAEAGLSSATLEKLRSTLPQYPRTAMARPQPEWTAPATVFHLPTAIFAAPATAQAGILRRMAEDSLCQRGARDKELVKRELSVFDRCFLNRYTLPLFGISQEVRAREAFLERKNRQFREEVEVFAGVLLLSNSKEAAALRTCLRQWQ